MRVKIEGDNEPQPTIPREEGQVPFVFVGTVESISNAKVLLEYHLAHLKVQPLILFNCASMLSDNVVVYIWTIDDKPIDVAGSRAIATREAGNRSAAEKHPRDEHGANAQLPADEARPANGSRGEREQSRRPRGPVQRTWKR